MHCGRTALSLRAAVIEIGTPVSKRMEQLVGTEPARGARGEQDPCDFAQVEVGVTAGATSQADASNRGCALEAQSTLGTP